MPHDPPCELPAFWRSIGAGPAYEAAIRLSIGCAALYGSPVVGS
jgi:hypothetical protein